MRQFIVTIIIFFLSHILLAQSKASWIDLPQSEWPQIALVNHVKYKNGDTYVHPSFSYAGTGFLIDTGDETFAVTVKHALWVAPNKESSQVEVNDALGSWVMKPKYNTSDSIVVDRLINEDPSEVMNGANSSILERDWLVFSLKEKSANIQTLKVREEPPKEGEKVYMLSCAYQDSLCTIAEGTIFRILGNDLVIDRDMSGNLGGASGSPIIDVNGHLLGIFSASWHDPLLGESVGIGVSTNYLKDILNKKKPLNVAKKSYGELLEEIINNKGVETAIKKYKELISDPQNYFTYNLRSSHGNDLLKLGRSLLEREQLDNAIAILKLNSQEYPAHFVGFNTLAKAYLQKGDKSSAIETYEASIKLSSDAQRNPAVEELKKLKEG